ncbi:hypothetical protein HZC32_00520 [Candidatus Woesearchaeota archaeon]|nr:hypothetical protein [Candidatus Woesearchaeota archaeon]
MCERNPDETAEEQFICSPGQVCINEVCYADKDEDGEPDSEKSLEGYFYKITWAVAAPSDEKLTPFIDENGVAVSFNIYLDNNADDQVSDPAIPLYQKGYNTKGPIELKNGALTSTRRPA